MPRKKAHRPPPVVQDYLDPDETPFLPTLEQGAEPEPEPEPEPELELEPETAAQSSGTGRNRNSDARIARQRSNSSSPETAPQHHEQIIHADSPLPSPRNASLLSQIAFPHSKSRPVNIRDEAAASEKVADQYTPPSDEGLHDGVYGRSPQSVAVSSPANTPPVEPGFSTRASYKIRSPHTSPAPRNARPVSFGGSIPPLPGYSRYPASSYGSPPAPHLPQPHFYAAHDIDIGIPNPSHASVNEEPAFAKLVDLPSPRNGHSHGILTGFDGCLTVSTFDATTIEEVGALCDLPGTCIDAEILPWSTRTDWCAALRPLVATTVYRCEATPTGITQHVFTVSVHSLSQQKHVGDLLTLTTGMAQQYMHGALPFTPVPSNHLRLSSSGDFLLVASGKSGEVFVFTPVLDGPAPAFECLAKLWTSLQPKEPRRDSSHHRSSVPDSPMLSAKRAKVDENVPVVSASGRWLAICPPTASPPSIGVVLHDSVRVGKHAGIESKSAGGRPTITCEVDSPDADTLLGKVARGVAQEVMRAGRWLGDQGMQYWQNYWKKDDPSHPQAPPNPLPHHPPLAYGQFPPTHADATPPGKDPELVSIFDLTSARDGAARRPGALSPFATFKTPHGCSFLSFAPHGLMLLTASRNGDYQYVWDLFETKHSRMAVLDVDDTTQLAPRVRQIARFDRLSSSVIVDVSWEYPSVARLAIVTKNKTIHLFDLPASALRWPPPRKAKPGRPLSDPLAGGNGDEHGAAPAGGFLASAMNFAGRTQPMLANLRGRAPSTSGGLAGLGQAGIGIATATGARGSKVVATGLSKSLGAATETVSRIQHAGENRLHVKSDHELCAGRLMWIVRSSKPGICMLNEQGIRYWQVRTSKARDSRQRESTVFDARKAVTVKLSSHAHQSGREPASYWKPRATATSDYGSAHPLSFAEIDTNAPFQPFHSDRRVTISLIELRHPKNARHGARKDDTWIFGDEISTNPSKAHPSSHADDDDSAPGSVIYRETLVTHDAVGPGEQIVSTSRRGKAKRPITHSMQGSGHQDELTQEGFFEDDCDVLDFASDRV